MDLIIPAAWAQQTAATGGSAWLQLLPLVLIFVVFYFLLIRPQTKRAKEHRTMVGGLKSGDEVVTTGGLLGRITAVEDSFITLEVTKGVAVKVQKFQVAQLMPKGTMKGD